MRPRCASRGFSLAETVAASAIAATLAAAVVGVAANAAVTRKIAAGERAADTLAAELAAELRAMPFGDPDAVGPGAGSGPRSGFSTLDDYAGWSASPAEDADGEAIDGAAFARTVSLAFVDPATGSESGTPTGVKRATVRVLRKGSVVAEVSVDRAAEVSRWWIPRANHRAEASGLAVLIETGVLTVTSEADLPDGVISDVVDLIGDTTDPVVDVLDRLGGALTGGER